MKSKYSGRIKRLKARGKSYRQIAELLGITISTVQYWVNPKRKRLNERCNNAWRAQNPLHKKIKDFRQRARALGRECGRFTQQQLLQKAGSPPCCYLTGKSINLTDTSSYVIDHFIPVGCGGNGTLENARLACADANKAKDAKTLEEFLELCAQVLRHHGFVVKRE